MYAYERLLAGLPAEDDEEGTLKMITVCDTMGWDFWTYQRQPQYFIDLIVEKRKVDAQHQQNYGKQHVTGDFGQA